MGLSRIPANGRYHYCIRVADSFTVFLHSVPTSSQCFRVLRCFLGAEKLLISQEGLENL